MKKSDRAEVMLEAARNRARQGDIETAIRQYQEIIATQSANRSVVARALVHVGQCYEKLGGAAARTTYERVVREFSDELEAVREARARLAAEAASSGGAGMEARTRLLWDRATTAWGTVSADGKYLSFPDWSTGEPAVRDLVAGQARRVTNRGGYAKSGGETEITAISADGKQVAFSWCRGAAGARKCELQIANVDGTGERVLLRDEQGRYIRPDSFSPDGKWVAASVSYEDGTRVVLVSVDGTRSRTVLPLHRVRSRVWFSPDGRWLAYSVITGGDESIFVLPAEGSGPETRVATEAKFMGWAPDGGSLVFARLGEEGHQLYQIPFAGGTATGEARQLQTFALRSNRGVGITRNGALLYELERFPAEVVTADFDAATLSIGTLSPPVIAAIAGQEPLWVGGGARFSPDGGRLLVLRSAQAFSIRSLADGSEEWTQVKPVKRIWQIEWASDGGSLYALAFEASQWGIHQINLQTGVATLVTKVGAQPVLAVSPTGRTLYWWDRDSKGVQAWDLTAGTARTVAAFRPGGLMDMRVSHDGKSVAMIQRRELQILNVATGEIRQMQGPSNIRGASWSADGRRIVTIENRQPPQIASYSVPGGEVVRRPFPPDHRGLWLSPDGKRMATMHMEQIFQVWALEKLLPPVAGRNE